MATQFTNSFEDILSEIRTREHEKQEQIYSGFSKLMEKQRKLLIARQNLSRKLNDSVLKPIIDTEGIEVAQKKYELSSPQHNLTDKEIHDYHKGLEESLMVVRIIKHLKNSCE